MCLIRYVQKPLLKNVSPGKTRLVLDNSPVARNILVLDIKPQLEPYNVGLCALKKSLNDPLVAAFWGETG